MPPVAPGPPAVPPGPPAVTDRRPTPRGVLPRGVQTWIMAGIALGMLAIMFVVGRPGPPARNAPAPALDQGPSADRVRDYQERLRTLEAQALREAQAATLTPPAPAAKSEESQTGRAPDPLETDRKRREYESLFASNVVLSRRPESERPDAGRASVPASQASSGSMPATPSIDDIADAAARASARAGGVRPSAEPVTPSAVAPPLERTFSWPRDARANGCHQRCRPPASGSRGHAHRHRLDESPRWKCSGARELPGDERDLFAQSAVRAHSGGCACAGRNEAGASVRRNAIGRDVSSPADA